MNTDSAPSTTPQCVLLSLVAEDRPWTVEELIRDKGGNRIEVEDALSDLECHGLLTRINKRVVCASRAAIHSDQLSI